MLQSFLSRFFAFLLLAGTIVVPNAACAQAVLPRAGQSFSFGIMEGPYSFSDSLGYLQQTSLTLTVVSAYSGCGIIASPSGYVQDFSFAPGAPTIIDLPMNLMHLNDLGKTRKGLLVHTTEPVNLVLHDYVQYGGEATQILPDSALDTSYVAFGWGIWDDIGEHDAAEFIVTASTDSTRLTITPSVRTLLNQPDSVPFTVILNRGECYIVKADTTDSPSDPSLSGSRISATKPVSVISGLTCGYTPLKVEACNELMDELIGRKWWGSHFFAQPLDLNDTGGVVVLTSSQDFTAHINAASISSIHGRLVDTFSRTAEIHVVDGVGDPFPVEAQQLTRSFSYCDSGSGDPSLVGVLDTAAYADTLLWNTPPYFFSHSVPIICPTADLGSATLDGKVLSQWGNSSVINGSRYSAINPPVMMGLHRIVSPDPVFAVPAGFYVADAYSFMAGTVGTEVPHDTASHVLLLQADSARTCSDFDVTASVEPPILASEGMLIFTVSVRYDPSKVHLLEIIPADIPDNASYTVDTSTPGRITITVRGTPLIAGSNLFRFVFEGWRTTASTSIGFDGISICGDDSELVTGRDVSLAISPSQDSLRRQFVLSNSPPSLCEALNVAVGLDSLLLPQDGLVLAKIEVLFSPLQLQLQGATRANLLAGRPFSLNISIPGDLQYLLTPPAQLSGGDSLLSLEFTPLIPNPSDTIRARIYYLECGDTLERDLQIIFPVANAAALVAPSSYAFDSLPTCLAQDSTVTIGDSSCVPITITNISRSGPDWTVLSSAGQPITFPIYIPGYSYEKFKVRFHPQTVGIVQDTITVTYQYLDTTLTRTIVLTGMGTAGGVLHYARSLSFGDVSICSPLDSSIALDNKTCDTVLVDSVRVTPPFLLATQLPLRILSGASGSIRLRYAPTTISTDTGLAIITMTVGDSLVEDTLTFTGTGKASGAMQYPRMLNVGNASLCSYLDTILSFTNKTCDTASIDSAIVTPPFVLLTPLPDTLGIGATAKVRLQFTPDALYPDTARAIFMLTVNGSRVTDTVTFIGSGKAAGTVSYPNGIAFGTVSVCSPADTEIVLSNETFCDAAIDSVSVSPPFELLDSVPLSLDSGTSDGLRIQYAPNSKTNDTGQAIIVLTVNGREVIDTLTLTGRGTAGKASLASSNVEDSIITTRSECDPPDTTSFYLFNPGCDTLNFASGFKVLANVPGFWKLGANPTTLLPPGDSVQITLISSDTTAGSYSGSFLTSYIDSDGAVHPFVLPVEETITAAARTLALDTTPIDLGTIAPCETHDTEIAYTNTGCGPVSVLGWTLSQWNEGYNVFGTGFSPPITLAPGAFDSLHLTFDGSHPGVVYDTVVVITGTNSDSVRRIPVQSFVPAVDTVDFLLRMPGQLTAGQSFTSGVYPDRAVDAGKGLTSISGRFTLPDNDFTFDSITAAPGLLLNTSGPWVANRIAREDFSVSNANGNSLDPATPIVQLWLEPLLTDSIEYALQLDSVLLNGGDSAYSNCALATGGSAVSATLSMGCGDSLLIRAGRGARSPPLDNSDSQSPERGTGNRSLFANERGRWHRYYPSIRCAGKEGFGAKRATECRRNEALLA